MTLTPYPKGTPIYQAEQGIRTGNGEYLEDFGDRQPIIYTKGDWVGDDDLGRLLHDFHSKNADDMHFSEMAERLRYLKETERGRMELTGLAKSFYNDGRTDVQRESAERMLKAGMAETFVAEMLALPLEYVEGIKAELNKAM